MLKLSREQLRYSIQALYDFSEFWNRIEDAAGCHINYCEVPQLCNIELNYLRLLEELCDIYDDESYKKYGTDISYFIYDLDFGKKWTPGSITYHDKDIPVRNVDELYDFIEMQYNDEYDKKDVK